MTILDEDDKKDEVVGQVLCDLKKSNLWRTGGVVVAPLQTFKVSVLVKGGVMRTRRKGGG